MFDSKKIGEIRDKNEKWEEGILKKTLDKFPERRDEYTTASGIPVKRLYTPLDIDRIDYDGDLGFPGEYPFTRGIQPTLYRGRLWTMRQYSGFGSALDSNRRYKYLLDQGTTGLSVAFDLPTQMGYDSDHPMAAGEVGKVGVAINSLRDMEILFDGIPLNKVSTSMTVNSTAAIILAMYIAVAETQGVPPKALRGTIQNDILKEYISRGTYIFPPRHSMRLTCDIIEYCSKNLPGWNSISVTGYHVREAGATAIQEIAFSMAGAICYIEAMLQRGLNVDEFAPRISFFFSTHNDFFEEISKFRAARRLWARIMKERFQAKHPRSMMLRFGNQTGGSTLTAQQPENNTIRSTIHALASVLGGTQSLACACMDEALCIPSEKAARIALRTQQIVAEESGVVSTVDPLAGSYFVESLTDQIEKEASAYIEKTDSLGGAVPSIEKGFFQREIAEAAYKYQKEIENGQRTVVGVNKYRIDEEPHIDIMKVDPDEQRRQADSIKKLKKERNDDKVNEGLDAIRSAANSDKNLTPFILDAVKAYTTSGEICDVLRDVWGVYKQDAIF